MWWSQWTWKSSNCLRNTCLGSLTKLKAILLQSVVGPTTVLLGGHPAARITVTGNAIARAKRVLRCRPKASWKRRCNNTGTTSKLFEFWIGIPELPPRAEQTQQYTTSKQPICVHLVGSSTRKQEQFCYTLLAFHSRVVEARLAQEATSYFVCMARPQSTSARCSCLPSFDLILSWLLSSCPTSQSML
jgi:hypothetical protein